MPTIGQSITQREYYTNSGDNPTFDNWGTYQYMLLEDIINNFLLTYVGDDKLINKVERYEVIFHAKRAIQELHYDALREIQGFELEVPDTLKIPLPHDFVSLVKVGYVSEDGMIFTINQNFNSSTPKSYLQDGTVHKNILFDNTDTALRGTPVVEENWRTGTEGDVDKPTREHAGGRYGLDPATTNGNGSYLIDKDQGFVLFSSNLKGKNIVIEYVSDGLYGYAESEIKIHKLAETFMYDYLVSTILKGKFGVQEFVVRRAQKQASASLRNAKIRLNSIKLGELTQLLKGKNKWIK